MSLIHASEEQVAKVGGKEMFARLLFWTKQITAKQFTFLLACHPGSDFFEYKKDTTMNCEWQSCSKARSTPNQKTKKNSCNKSLLTTPYCVESEFLTVPATPTHQFLEVVFFFPKAKILNILKIPVLELSEFSPLF